MITLYKEIYMLNGRSIRDDQCKYQVELLDGLCIEIIKENGKITMKSVNRKEKVVFYGDIIKEKTGLLAKVQCMNGQLESYTLEFLIETSYHGGGECYRPGPRSKNTYLGTCAIDKKECKTRKKRTVPNDKSILDII